MGILETLSAIGTAGTGVGATGSFISGLIGGYLQNKQAEKAQAYQEAWMNRLYENQLGQQDIQNKRADQELALKTSEQYFLQDMKERQEARQGTSDWRSYMQDAANKYADVLYKSRELRKSNAAALRNRR